MLSSFLYISPNFSSTLPCLEEACQSTIFNKLKLQLRNIPLFYNIMPEEATCEQILDEFISIGCSVGRANLHMLDYLCVSLLGKIHIKLVLCLELFCNLLQLIMELLDLGRGILYA